MSSSSPFYLGRKCGSQNKSCSNSPNTEERSLNAAFIVSFSIGYSAPSFMKTEVKTLP